MKKVKITLTEFIDFIMRSGPAKLTKVKKVIQMRSNNYGPYMDFYKPIRDKIVELHKKGLDKIELKEMLEKQRDEKKISNYPPLIDGYIRFLGRKEITWFQPPSNKMKKGDLSISINPELGLKIKGTNYIIKLYFKQEPLDKRHADICLTIMKNSLLDVQDKKIAILDVARKKLFTTDKLKTDYLPLVEGEALSFLSMWNELMKDVA